MKAMKQGEQQHSQTTHAPRPQLNVFLKGLLPMQQTEESYHRKQKWAVSQLSARCTQSSPEKKSADSLPFRTTDRYPPQLLQEASTAPLRINTQTAQSLLGKKPVVVTITCVGLAPSGPPCAAGDAAWTPDAPKQSQQSNTRTSDLN